MSDLVARLKQARKDKGLSLEDLFEQTKIQVHLLKALEEEEYHLFPGEVYARGALRNYAEAVGLDYREILALYQNAQKPVEKAAPQPSGMDRENREARRVIRRRRKSPRRRKLFLILLLVLALIVSLIYLAALYTGRRAPGPDPEEPVTEDPVADPEDPGDEEPEDPGDEEPQPVITLEQPNPALEEYRLTGADTLELEITFRADCWLAIFIGNNRVTAGTYRRGQTFTYSSARDFRVRLGNPGGVDAFLVNGQAVNVKNTDRPYNIELSLVRP